MISRCFQNLVQPRRLVHSGRGEAPLLLPGGQTGSLANAVRRLRAWLAGIDRKRRIENDNARAIAHLHSLTDAQLRDIGIARPDIERAVRLGRDSD